MRGRGRGEGEREGREGEEGERGKGREGEREREWEGEGPEEALPSVPHCVPMDGLCREHEYQQQSSKRRPHPQAMPT